MDARPTAEQRQLQEAAERLAIKLGPRSVGDLDDAARRERLAAAMAQSGWRDLRSGDRAEPLASGVEAAIVTRALARRACDTAFIGPVLARDLSRRAGVGDDSVLRTFAVSGDLQRLYVDTADDSDPLAVDVSGSTSAVVLVASGNEHTVAEVALGSPLRGVDLTRPVAHLTPDAIAEPISGAAALSHDDLAAWTALAVTLTAADLVGTMEGALTLATEYAKERHQYGAAIGSYQAVQHLLAEGATLAEGSISATMHAAWAVDALSPDEARAAAAVAKAYTSRAARTVCETAIQVHGGIGNTWECMAHVFLRRSLLATELLGGDGPQLALLANHRWGAGHGLR